MQEKEILLGEELEFIHSVEEKDNVKFNLEGKKTYDAVGCSECNNSGYYERIGIFEVLVLDENIKDLISNGASSLDIRRQALKNGYRPLVIDGINKVIQGITTLEELNYKLSLY